LIEFWVEKDVEEFVEYVNKKWEETKDEIQED